MNFIDVIKNRVVLTLTAASTAGGVAYMTTSTGEIGNQKHEHVQKVYVRKVKPPTNMGAFLNTLKAEKPGLFPGKVDTAKVNQIWYHLEQLSTDGSDSISVQYAIAVCMTIWNETGGKFLPLLEMPPRNSIDGGADYFFEARKVAVNKSSYNLIAGNIPAGRYLWQKGILTNPQDTFAWNGFIYPSWFPLHVRMASLNADYYKYRGRGWIQLTGRTNYVRCVSPILKNMGIDMESITSQKLDELFQRPDVYIESMVRYLLLDAKNRKIIASLATDNPDWDAFGHIISGRAQYYRFRQRCQYVYDRMILEGFKEALYNERDTVSVQDSTITRTSILP